MKRTLRILARLLGRLVADRKHEDIWTKPSPGYYIANSDGSGGKVISPNGEGGN